MIVWWGCLRFCAPHDFAFGDPCCGLYRYCLVLRVVLYICGIGREGTGGWVFLFFPFFGYVCGVPVCVNTS